MPPNTRRTYATALRQLRAWLDDRPLDDASLVAYVGAPPPDRPGAGDRK